MEFRYLVDDATESGNELVVYLGDPVLGNIIGAVSLDETTSDWTARAFEIPSAKAGTVQALTFEIA